MSKYAESAVETVSKHLLVEFSGCAHELLNDEVRLVATMRRAASAAHATVVNDIRHRFTPHGVSVVLLLEESHCSIHTWPEAGYAAVDFYTCGACQPEQAIDILRRELGALSAERMVVHRGLPGATRMRVFSHERRRHSQSSTH